MERIREEVKFPKEWEKRDIYSSVFLNRYGYYELRRQNTPEERGRNFEENYFQNYAGQTYAKEYPESELQFIRAKLEERDAVISENLRKARRGCTEGYSLLDIGCGEGFLLKYFQEKGVRVKGIDFGGYALRQFHPELLSCFEQGNMESLLPEMAKRGEVYDVVNADRVLDMVPDAGESVGHMKEVMAENGILVVKVANNYSNIQRMLLETGELKKEHWLDDPDHTGYFNREGLVSLMEECGMECLDFYGDTFVDFQLLNSYSNYYERPETGREAHRTAVRIENLLHEISPERTIEIFRLLGEMGFGREIVGIFAKKK